MSRMYRRLLFGAAVLAGVPGYCFAQEQTGEEQLQQVIVTATKRAESTQNVPMSIAAITRETIDAQGLKDVQDLARVVPGLTMLPTTGGAFVVPTNPPILTIRGISIGGGTAPTTGVYLDDVPLSTRILNTGGGAQLPQLFDLDRVEVLYGPQGTLYGGGSEGGTIRFITPQPNFNTFDANLRGELAHQEVGEPNMELGARISGPIIQDELAGLVSVWRRIDGGYVDHVSRFTGNVIASNTNGESHDVLRGVLAYKPSNNFKATLSYFFFDDNYKDADTYWNNMAAITQTLGPVTGSPPHGVQYTYGPYNVWGPYKTGENTAVGDLYYTSDAQLAPLLQPHWDYTRLPSLTLDWNMGPVSGKLIASYLQTYGNSQDNTAYTDIGGQSCAFAQIPGGLNIQGVTLNCFPTTADFFATVPLYTAPFDQFGTLDSHTEELRFSSNNAGSPFSWVGGLFFNRSNLSSEQNLIANLGSPFSFLQVPGTAYYYIVNGNSGLPANGPQIAPLTPIVFTQAYSVDKTQAVYAELTYRVGNFRMTGGVRYEKSDFQYIQYQAAPLFGTSFLPNGEPPLAFQGHMYEKPVTPKANVQYFITPDNNIYFDASKGYRPGGINQPANTDNCVPQEQYLGVSIPDTFGPDSLWSYSLGTKNLLWNGRVSLNADVYYIDWSGVQTGIDLGEGICGFTGNVGKVISKGGELDFAALLFHGLTLQLQAAYTDAYFKDTVAVGPTVFINSGDQVIGNSKFEGNISGQYAFDVLGVPSYLRLDWQYRSSWHQTQGPGTTGYDPLTYTLGGFGFGSLRLGADVQKVAVSFFITNLTASTAPLVWNGLSGPAGPSFCENVACTVYGNYRTASIGDTYRPRTFGIDVNYRY